MYLKLAFRNAKRSICNYLLYITTMTILIAVMTVSNGIAIAGKLQAGFETASLPILVTLISVILADYINHFMLKQRGNEFANYLLLGMEANKLTWMFLAEFSVFGLVCFGMGELIGSGMYLLPHLFQISQIQPSFFIENLMQTFLYFSVIEFLSALRLKQTIVKLQVIELMTVKNRNQEADSRFCFGEQYAESV